MNIVVNMRLYCLLAVVVLLCFSAPAYTQTSQPAGLPPPVPAHLNANQKAIANKIINELITSEQFAGPNMQVNPDIYKVQVDTLASVADPLLPKLPNSDLKKVLTFAVNAHEDLSTVASEFAKYPYYDLIQNQRTPQIMKKYGMTISLQSNLPYGQLDSKTKQTVLGTLSQVAIILRERAQSEVK